MHTKHVTDNKDPIWRESFAIEYAPGIFIIIIVRCHDRNTANIKLTVKDYERVGSDKEIGSVIVPAVDIPLHTKYEHWVKINSNGEIHIEAYWHPVIEK